ncbi:hypothetical protein TNCV_4898591 [Trichonephila clavipes]|nr:hypothetical protein TNCV_4898591 [Trichonephila clavipes]
MYTILLSVFFRGLSGFLKSPLEIFSHKTSSGLNSFTCFASMKAHLKLSTSVFFLVPIVFTKQDKNTFHVGFLVNDASMDLALPSCIFQCVWFLGQRHGHHGRGNVLGEGIDLVRRARLM